ncbi:unnamed protein product [marine sediment metagenome]|uniref:UspA domain-containing protein n=1 Tax=marine sediment metagenome TaxID=412755 RepID=X1AWA2_9ZZZZ
MRPMNTRLLVAVNGSEESYKALTHAVTIAEEFGSELKIVTVVPTQYYCANINESNHLDTIFFDVQDRLIIVYKKVLAKAEAKIRSEYPDMNVNAILVEGRPSVKIVDLAEKERCDMIVVGRSPKISGIIGMILDWMEKSTSNIVLDDSKVNVMVVAHS